MLCKYKNILGEPKKGIHSIRVYDIAIIDVILTIIGAYIINYIITIFNALNIKSKLTLKDIIINMYKSFNIRFIIILVIIFTIGIISHRLFCVRTTIDKLLFK